MIVDPHRTEKLPVQNAYVYIFDYTAHKMLAINATDNQGIVELNITNNPTIVGNELFVCVEARSAGFAFRPKENENPYVFLENIPQHDGQSSVEIEWTISETYAKNIFYLAY